jgi:hypothetical protein
VRTPKTQSNGQSLCWCALTFGFMRTCDVCVEMWRRLVSDADCQDSDKVDFREALAVPSAEVPPTGSVRACRVSDGWYRAENRRLGWVLSARWDPAEFPWLCLWTQHCERQQPPWNARERTRGMEITTKPFPEGRPPASRFPTFSDRSTRCDVPAAPDAITKTVSFTWQRVQ